MKIITLSAIVLITLAQNALSAPFHTPAISYQKQPGKADTGKVSPKTMQLYVGDYYLSSAPKRTISIFIHENTLCGKFSPTQTVVMIPVSQTKFDFKTVSPKANAEFVVTKGAVQKMVVEQGGQKYEWIRKS